MIRTDDDLEEISQEKTSSGDVESLTYIPPNEVADIEQTKELAYQLYIDEDKKRWNYNTQASIIVGSNALVVAIIGTLFQGIELFISGCIIAIPLSLSLKNALDCINLRDAYRPIIAGDTAKKLDMGRDEYMGVIAYTYIDNFFLNKKENKEKATDLKESLLYLKITLVLTGILIISVLIWENWLVLADIVC